MVLAPYDSNQGNLGNTRERIFKLEKSHHQNSDKNTSGLQVVPFLTKDHF